MASKLPPIVTLEYDRYYKIVYHRKADGSEEWHIVASPQPPKGNQE